MGSENMEVQRINWQRYLPSRTIKEDRVRLVPLSYDILRRGKRKWGVMEGM